MESGFEVLVVNPRLHDSCDRGTIRINRLHIRIVCGKTSSTDIAMSISVNISCSSCFGISGKYL